MYLTTYYQAEEALVGVLHWGNLIALVIAVVVLAAGTLLLFDKRDIGTGATFMLPGLALLRRRREEPAS